MIKSLQTLSVALLALGFTAAQASPYSAARNGDLETLRQYRFEGKDLYLPDERGFIPYELAALHANPDSESALQRNVELMLWLKELNPSKHTYGKAANALVQASLNALGYNAGASDGILGANSTNAIRAYQRDNELAETGRLGPQWLGMLYQDSLKDLQFKLSKLGYETHGTDGMMGPNTQKAMTKFRQDKGLSAPNYPHVDGLLLASVNKSFAQEEKRKKDAIEEKARQENLRQTRYAQAGLRALGYRIGKVDGMAGSKTANAIKAFQKKHQLSVTGNLDKKTTAKMRDVFTKDTQKKLNALGYDVGKPDGQLGKRSISALRKYRSSQGLPETGGVNADLLSSLHSNYVTTENKRKEKAAEDKAKKDAYRIRFAQAGLRTLGHPLSIDGMMGKTTEKYIKTFQKRYNLKRTGQVDDSTYAKMRTIFLKETQRKLNALGYKTGKPDGQLGKNTQIAIKKYRKKVNLAGGGVTADLIASVDDSFDKRSKKKKKTTTPVKTVAKKTAQRKATVKKQASKKAPQPKKAKKVVAKKTTQTVSSKKTPVKATIKKKTPNKPIPIAKTEPVKKKAVKKPVAVAKTTKRRSSGRSAKGRMSFSRRGGRVVGCSIAGRNIPIEWCEPFYPLPRNNHCEATFKPSNGAVINLWCK